MNSLGADVISIEICVSVRCCGARLGGDKQVVAKGSIQNLRRAARDRIDAGGSKGHILNLNHGLFQDTPFEDVQAFVDEAHQSSATKNEDATQGASHP